MRKILAISILGIVCLAVSVLTYNTVKRSFVQAEISGLNVANTNSVEGISDTDGSIQNTSSQVNTTTPQELPKKTVIVVVNDKAPVQTEVPVTAGSSLEQTQNQVDQTTIKVAEHEEEIKNLDTRVTNEENKPAQIVVQPLPDVCQNIEGAQSSVPAGMILENGNCVTPTPTAQPEPVKDTTAPEGYIGVYSTDIKNNTFEAKLVVTEPIDTSYLKIYHAKWDLATNNNIYDQELKLPFEFLDNGTLTKMGVWYSLYDRYVYKLIISGLDSIPYSFSENQNKNCFYIFAEFRDEVGNIGRQKEAAIGLY